jgi:hypothetical protein
VAQLFSLGDFAHDMTTYLNRWKIAFFVLAFVAFITIGYLALSLFDQSMTLSLVDEHCGRVDTALSVFRAAMPAALHSSGRVSQADLLAILQKQNPSAPIVSGASKIEMDQIRFCFAPDGSLDRIEQTDDYGTRASDSPTNRDTVR